MRFEMMNPVGTSVVRVWDRQVVRDRRGRPVAIADAKTTGGLLSELWRYVDWAGEQWSMQVVRDFRGGHKGEVIRGRVESVPMPIPWDPWIESAYRAEAAVGY